MWDYDASGCELPEKDEQVLEAFGQVPGGNIEESGFHH